MLEYYGAMGTPPGPHAWHEYQRMFLGWQRQWECLFAHLWQAVLNSAGVTARRHEMSNLIPYLHSETPTVPVTQGQAFDMLRQCMAKGDNGKRGTATGR